MLIEYPRAVEGAAGEGLVQKPPQRLVLETEYAYVEILDPDPPRTTILGRKVNRAGDYWGDSESVMASIKGR